MFDNCLLFGIKFDDAIKMVQRIDIESRDAALQAAALSRSLVAQGSAALQLGYCIRRIRMRCRLRNSPSKDDSPTNMPTHRSSRLLRELSVNMRSAIFGT